MTYKQIEASREIRLWTTQVILPLLLMGTTVAMVNPDVKEVVLERFRELKKKIRKSHK